jgi:hypothetical protein
LTSIELFFTLKYKFVIQRYVSSRHQSKIFDARKMIGVRFVENIPDTNPKDRGKISSK